MTTFDKDYERALQAAAPTLTIKELKIGDVFETPASRRQASTDGVITQLTRTKFSSTKNYMGHPTTITLDRRDLIGGKVRRDGVVYGVVSG
jgi:hypothetical protein